VSALAAARLFDSGRAQLDAGRAWTALAYFKKAVARSPKNPDAWFGLALARTDLRQTALARDAANKALALDPRHPGATLLLGFLAQQRRDTVTARQLYARYLELEPDGAWASEVKTVIAQLP
jgi:cytochrome c-type biogenesis protein CcmH/NrfG